jgi:hypothetical protein
MAPTSPLSGWRDGALIAAVGQNRLCLGFGGSSVHSVQSTRVSKGGARKVSCDDCYFRANLLCALALEEPCATFRPREANLRPPQQLRLVFRQERRARAAWAFPSAQEQAALHG